MEKILHKGIYQFFDQHKLFVKEKHGFRQNASTETANFNLLNTILKSLDSKSTVGGLFLDICEAFDSVDRNILLSKLDFYVISGKSNKLMKSYIKNRYQRVVMNINNSNKIVATWKQVKHGAPQGSILDPCYF